MRTIDLANVELLEDFRTLKVKHPRQEEIQQFLLGAIAGYRSYTLVDLYGMSGVGKSSLLTAIQPSLDLRIGAISGYTGKGRHTTTTAKRYPLDKGGYVVDTPGVKLFGLWNVTRENLEEFFPDVAAGSAPQWRMESFERIRESLRE